MKNFAKKICFLMVFALIAFQSSAQWTTSGTSIYNTNSGNVGIGTSAPGARLDINGDPANSVPMTIRNNASNVLGIYSSVDVSGALASIQAYRSRGTLASPTALLTGDRVTGFYGLPYFNGGYRASAGMEIYVGQGVSSSSYPAYILFGTTPTNGTTRLERMRITESGTVGIGTMYPNTNYLLDVNGAINATSLYVNNVAVTGGSSQWAASGSNIYSTNAGNVIIGSSTQTGSYGANERVIQVKGTTNSWLNLRPTGSTKWFEIGVGEASGSAILYAHSTPLTLFADGVRMTIDNVTGNVGIGTLLTSNPNNYKLAVNGTIGAKEVKVENTSATWPDYVFKPEFKLTSLESLEAYVTKEGHLPEVPTAAEVEKNGQALGEMNTVLLKKVEELTLYLFAIQKEINEVKVKNESLQKELESLKK